MSPGIVVVVFVVVVVVVCQSLLIVAAFAARVVRSSVIYYVYTLNSPLVRLPSASSRPDADASKARRQLAWHRLLSHLTGGVHTIPANRQPTARTLLVAGDKTG